MASTSVDVRNLLSNAEKYSDPGTTISVGTRKEADSVVVSVRDRGVGAAPGEESQLFEQFYRSPRTAATAGGAGLGLTVCKRLVEVMGGQIQARRRSGGGLEVSFSLPVREPLPGSQPER